MRNPLSDDALAACQLSADALAGKLFATPAGRLWLAANEQRFPIIVAEIRARLVRCRKLWGDIS